MELKNWQSILFVSKVETRLHTVPYLLRFKLPFIFFFFLIRSSKLLGKYLERFDLKQTTDSQILLSFMYFSNTNGRDILGQHFAFYNGTRLNLQIMLAMTPILVFGKIK
jgi:hypothetical protein